MFVVLEMLQLSENVNREDEEAKDLKNKQESQGQGRRTTNMSANYTLVGNEKTEM